VSGDLGKKDGVDMGAVVVFEARLDGNEGVANAGELAKARQKYTGIEGRIVKIEIEKKSCRSVVVRTRSAGGMKQEVW
jgi:hypothetical protein